MLSHHVSHKVCEEFILYVLVLDPDQQYNKNDINQLIKIHRPSSVYQTSHIVAIVSRTHLQRVHAWFGALLFLPLLLTWDDHGYHPTPCLH